MSPKTYREGHAAGAEQGDQGKIMKDLGANYFEDKSLIQTFSVSAEFTSQ